MSQHGSVALSNHFAYLIFGIQHLANDAQRSEKISRQNTSKAE